MFTGLIEEIGTMRAVKQQGEAMVLTIEASKVLQDVKLGESIAVNGVCLTVVAFDQRSFTVDVMPQTYRHSNLQHIRSGEPVNLERAMAVNSRFGGHIVQGHVDTTATIAARETDANAVMFTIRPERADVMRYIIAQGSITVDGISLTVVSTADQQFTVSIIPHTLKETALQWKRAGDLVNLETDILGKYVEHLLQYGRKDSQSKQAQSGKLTADFLAEHGFA